MMRKENNPKRHKQYEKYFDRYDWSGMNFPVGTRDIEKFMNNNPNIVIKAYSLRVENIHMTKKQFLDSKKPFYFPTYTPEELKDKKVVYMLFLFPSEEVIADRLNKNNYDVGHIVPIVDINKFLFGWRSDNNYEYICDCCGSTFRTEKLRDEHINKGCYVDKTGQYKLDNKNLFFNSHSCCPRNPFIGYSDIETNMEKLGADDDWDTEHIPQAIEIHCITKYEFIFKMFDIPTHFKEQGEDCIPKYVEYLLLFYKKKKLTEKQYKSLPDEYKDKKISFDEYVRHSNFKCSLSQEEQEQLKREATKCAHCGYTFDDAFWENADDEYETFELNLNDNKKEQLRKSPKIFEKLEKLYGKQVKYDKLKLKKIYDDFMKDRILPPIIKEKPPKRSPLYKKKNRQKVLDHDQLLENDNVVGVCHSYCNLNRQPRRFFIPIVFHNGANYDFHELIRYLINYRTKNRDISVIPKSAYNFLSFQWGIFKFIDSRKFLNDSEEVLADQLANRKDGKDTKRTNYDKFIQLKTYFENHPNERFKKGDWKLLTKKGALPYEYISPEHYKDTCLPPLSKFISKLTGKSITGQNIKNFKIYGTHSLVKTLVNFLKYILKVMF